MSVVTTGRATSSSSRPLRRRGSAPLPRRFARLCKSHRVSTSTCTPKISCRGRPVAGPRRVRGRLGQTTAGCRLRDPCRPRGQPLLRGRHHPLEQTRGVRQCSGVMRMPRGLSRVPGTDGAPPPAPMWSGAAASRNRSAFRAAGEGPPEDGRRDYSQRHRSSAYAVPIATSQRTPVRSTTTFGR